MPRKTKEEAEKTRKGILKATLDLIYENGYSATNLNDIAERLGMTRGAVYWHFKNKLDLFYSLISEIEGEIDDLLTERAKKVNSLNDLEAFFRYYAELMISNDRMFKYLTVLTLKIEWNEELAKVVKLFRKQLEELDKFCVYSLKTAERKKELRPGIDKTLTAKSIVALVDGCLFNSVPPFGQRNTDLIFNALETFFIGLKR